MNIPIPKFLEAIDQVLSYPEHLRPWHLWYAWHPTTIGDRWVWRETVWRRVSEQYAGCPDGTDWNWEYSLADPMKDEHAC